MQERRRIEAGWAMRKVPVRRDAAGLKRHKVPHDPFRENQNGKFLG